MKQKIELLLQKSIESLQRGEQWPAFSVPKIDVSYPKQAGFGDYTTNIAMVLAKLVGKSPMDIAQDISHEIAGDIVSDEVFEKIEVAKPGYLNIYLSPLFFQNAVRDICEKGSDYGVSEIGSGIKVNNEFISANPTGPMHLGNGRGGFYGDVVSRVLRKCGFEVTSEYYVNDAGEQVIKLAHSVLKDDEAVYGGEYIDEVAEYMRERNISVESNDRKQLLAFGQSAAKFVLENYIQKSTQEKMNIKFDVWFSENSLYQNGFIEKALQILRDKGLTYEQEGALWLKTIDFGDDKDRVLVKNDGSKTYFASDCGYILNKMERGFSYMIETWGADHHGYINRFRAAAKALGFEGEIRFVMVQLVKLVKDGKEVRMSKRAGNVVFVDDIVDSVSHDVARFFFLMYAPDTHMNFDMGLAQERSQKNPVFYVQYAYARMCSILQKASEIEAAPKIDLTLLKHEKEIALIREMMLFPELLQGISRELDVHKLPHYAIRLADRFHSFYNDCQVIDESNLDLTMARLELLKAVKIVLGEALQLIGVSAPEKM